MRTSVVGVGEIADVVLFRTILSNQLILECVDRLMDDTVELELAITDVISFSGRYDSTGSDKK